jgi:hypothetical protein
VVGLKQEKEEQADSAHLRFEFDPERMSQDERQAAAAQLRRALSLLERMAKNSGVPRRGTDPAALPETQIARESSLTAVQPINLMSRSNSVCIKPSARSTPAWPAAARG